MKGNVLIGNLVERVDADGGRAAGVGTGVQPDHRGHPEDNQPQRLGLLTGGDECRGRPSQRVNEGPSLSNESRDRENLEEPVERGVSPRCREHDFRLSGPGETWDRVPVLPGFAGAVLSSGGLP